MAKPPTNPALIDCLPKIPVSVLGAGFGIPESGGAKCLRLKWGADSVVLVYEKEVREPYVCAISTAGAGSLSCKRFRLICKPSNIGRGLVWYFVCPETEKACRALYLAKNGVVSRWALQAGGALYESQAQSKLVRVFGKCTGYLFKAPKIERKMQRRYLKPTYAGSTTRTYLRLQRQLAKAQAPRLAEWETALLERVAGISANG